MKDLNMTAQYRAELKTLKKNRKKVINDARKFDRGIQKQVDDLNRQSVRSEKSVVKIVDKMDHRIAILEGRLS